MKVWRWGLADQKLILEKGEKTAKFSSVIVATIGLAKGIVGVFSGSISLLAQAVDSLTDVFASLTVYVGLKVAGRKPTDRFPYGYYRAETVASLLVAALIIFSGATILEESIMRFLLPEAVSFPQIALLVAAISIPFLYFLAKYNWRGDKFSSFNWPVKGFHFRCIVICACFLWGFVLVCRIFLD